MTWRKSDYSDWMDAQADLCFAGVHVNLFCLNAMG